MVIDSSGCCVQNVEVVTGTWNDLANLPDVSDKTNIIPAHVKVDGVGCYIEDLKRGIPRGIDLLTPFSPMEEIRNSNDSGDDDTIRCHASRMISEDFPIEESDFEESDEKKEEKNEPNWFQRWFLGKKAESKNVTEDTVISSVMNKKMKEGGTKWLRRGWQIDVDDNVELKDVFSFDGRVPWRRLLAPFCRRQLYDPILMEWVDDPNVMEMVLNKQRVCSPCGSRMDVDSKEEQINIYKTTDILGFVYPAEDNSDPIVLPNASIIDEVDTQPRLLQMSPNGSLPSLRLRVDRLNDFLNVAAKLNDAYHDYVLEPRALEVGLTLSTVPTLPSSPMKRCWSKWGEEHRPPEVSNYICLVLFLHLYLRSSTYLCRKFELICY